MKKYLLLTVCTALMGACVSNDYDLGKDIDTDNVVIGNSESVFEMPLANIRVGINELTTDQGDITTLFSDVEAWIPASYPFIEVQRLGESKYINDWVEALCKGMDDDPAEFNRVVEYIYNNRKANFSQWISVAPDADLNTYKTAFRSVWDNAQTRSEIKNEIDNIVASEVASIDTEVSYDCPIQNDGLDEGVIDMLVDEQREDALSLFGTIENKMEPIEGTLKAEFVGTSVETDNVLLPAASKAEIPYVNIPADDVYTIVQDGSLRVTVTPVKYYPRKAYPQDEVLFVQLKLRKKGGLKVN